MGPTSPCLAGVSETTENSDSATQGALTSRRFWPRVSSQQHRHGLCRAQAIGNPSEGLVRCLHLQIEVLDEDACALDIHLQI